MVSERLEEFLAVWCDVDADPDVVDQMVRTDARGNFSWLKEDLSRAIKSHDLTVATITDLTNIWLVDQEAADNWLRRRWEAWFPTDRYPG